MADAPPFAPRCAVDAAPRCGVDAAARCGVGRRVVVRNGPGSAAPPSLARTAVAGHDAAHADPAADR
jgi:hypothetical protein